MRHIKRTQIALGFLSLILFCGCENKAVKGPDDRVLARINNYELTIADFKEEVDLAILKRYASASPLKDKEQALETLVTKEILLQEAQRLNLDKEKSFMREIEGYWEQALLKSLINRKLAELAAGIVVSDREALDEYNRRVSSDEEDRIESFERSRARIRQDLLRAKKQALLEKWSAELKGKASIKVDKELLKEIEPR